jgi:hypothetical protein
MDENRLKNKALLEIEILRKGFKIIGKGRDVHVKKGFLIKSKEVSSKTIIEILNLIESEVWNKETLDDLLEQGLNFNEQLLQNFHWNSPFIGSGADYLSTLSLYSDQTILFDPIPLFNKESPDSPFARPETWINVIVNFSLFLCSIEEWIKNGFAIVLPRPALWMPGMTQQMINSEMPRLIQGGDKLLKRDFPEAFAQALFVDPPYLREALIEKIRREGGLNANEEDETRKKLKEIEQANPVPFYQEPRDDGTGRYGSMSVIGSGSTFPEAKWLQNQTGCFVGSSEQSIWDKIKYHSHEILSGTKRKESIIGRALTMTNLEGLKNADVEYAMEIREKGALPAFRTLLRDSYAKINVAEDALHIKHAVNEMRDRIKGEVNELKSVWDEVEKSSSRRIFGYIPSGLIAGTAIATGLETQQFNILVGSATAAISYLGVKEFAGNRNKKAALRKNPLYVLLKPQGRYYF